MTSARLLFSFLTSIPCAAPLVCQQPENGVPTRVPAPEATAATATQDAAVAKQQRENQWIVHFATAPFALDPLREAVRNGITADAYSQMTTDLSLAAQHHQAMLRLEVERLGGRVLHSYWLVNACAIELDARHVAALLAVPNVERVTPNLIHSPANCGAQPIKVATNQNNHDVDVLHSVGLRGAGGTIAIVDTGLDTNMAGIGRPHRTFFPNGNPLTPTGPGIGGSRVLVNRTFGPMPADAPSCTHGTSVAGVASGGNWGTVDADHGHAYEAGIAGYSVLNPIIPSWCNTDSATVAAAWQGVVADKVLLRIVTANFSYHQDSDPQDIASMAMDAAADTANILICTIAGNYAVQFPSQPWFNSPAAVNALSVGAVHEDSHVVWSDSGFGPRPGGEVFPDLCANGVNTVMPKGETESLNEVWSGTSFAAPQVAGTATILRTTYPLILAPTVKAILLAGTVPMPGSGAAQVQRAGCGYFKSTAAMRIAASPDKHGFGSLANGSSVFTRTLHADAGVPCTIAVAWFRKNVSSANWANLSLRIKQGGTTLAASLNPQRNTEEFLRFTPPVTGAYTIEITGSGIPAGGQEFGWASSCRTTP